MNARAKAVTAVWARVVSGFPVGAPDGITGSLKRSRTAGTRVRKSCTRAAPHNPSAAPAASRVPKEGRVLSLRIKNTLNRQKNRLKTCVLPNTDRLKKIGLTENKRLLMTAVVFPESFWMTVKKSGTESALTNTLIPFTAATASAPKPRASQALKAANMALKGKPWLWR